MKLINITIYGPLEWIIYFCVGMTLSSILILGTFNIFSIFIDRYLLTPFLKQTRAWETLIYFLRYKKDIKAYIKKHPLIDDNQKHWKECANIESESGDWDLFFPDDNTVNICLFDDDVKISEIKCTPKQFQELIDTVIKYN